MSQLVQDLFNLPVALRGVSSSIPQLVNGVFLREVDEAANQAEIDAWFDEVKTWLASDPTETLPAVSAIPESLRDAVDFDPDSRQLTLRMAALSDLEAQLAGIDGLSFVVNPDGFEAIATLTNDGVEVEFRLELALRFQPHLLEPVQVIQEAGGRVRYEADPSRSHTEIRLGSLTVIVTPDGDVEFAEAFSGDIADPVRLAPASNLPVDAASLFLDLTAANRCLALRWQSTQLGAWLGTLADNFREEGPATSVEVLLRMELGDPIESIRVDWRMAGVPRNYQLPGLTVTTPANIGFSVILASPASTRLNRFLFVLTLPNGAGQTITAASNFAWERDRDREVQNDSQPEADSEPLILARFVPKQAVSLVLIDWTFTNSGLPTFFRQLQGNLPELNFNQPSTLLKQIEIGEDDLIGLSADAWESIKVEFNAEQFDFPFLRQDQRDQRIQLKLPEEFDINLADSEAALEVEATARIGELLLNSNLDFIFNWETFALRVEHNEGLKLLSTESVLKTSSGEDTHHYLGLNWRFTGALQDDGRYHHLSLVTKDYNYQLVQADGATIELEYTLASDEPIIFIVSNLAISDTGITLTAEVSDQPAKLNGLDTRFRFHGSRLEIVDNQIQDFTLAGSGPLPPDLVGEAIADVALQFSQRDGALTLVSGGATLRGDKLLKCQGTRFEFAIDAMGLKFVNDGKFHLYFTLTGSAQFLPLPTDNPNGPLALLSGVKIQLVECPLTSDISVIGQHVNFLIELPEKVSFSFLGCFEMEVRSIGFVPQFERFGGDAAMEIGGQVKFAQGKGDLNTVQIDFHSLFIGLPAEGSFIPRLFMRELEVSISLGEAFNLHGVVEFRDEPAEQGFLGEGTLEIPGMPVFAASFAFLRVRRSESEPWVRAWFVYLEARQISLYIPYVQLYIREVGLGFGYRYTIASIRAADEEADLGALIGQLRELSRTQGDLSKRDRWAVDLEGPGEDLRWTIVLRALISQTSATPGSMSLKWLEHIEQTLPCLFLFDAVVAFRSDLTFFMAVRAWINSNYYDYVNDVNELRERPLFSGFVLLSVRQKRFLAQISSNPNGSLGTRPELPVFIQQAVLNGQFAATILVEPALLHAELGWPNMLRWGQTIGPLEAEVSGGMIFRVSKHNLVLGISYKARGSLSFEAGLNLKVVGVRVSAHASFAWGARYIGVINFADPVKKSALYAAIGLEIQIRVAIAIWIKLLFIKKTFRFSLEIGFTAGVELGISGLVPGLRGTGTLFISAMGRSFQVSVKLGLNEKAVQTALERTAGFLNLGLEATEVDPVPGVAGTAGDDAGAIAPAAPQAAAVAPPPRPQALRMAAAPIDTAPPPAAATAPASSSATGVPPAAPIEALEIRSPDGVKGFDQPHYDLFVIRPRQADEWGYFVLFPREEPEVEPPEDSGERPELGFLPVPPVSNATSQAEDFVDFWLQFPETAEDFTLEHFRPVSDDTWHPLGNLSAPLTWQADWDAPIEQATQYADDGSVEAPSQSLRLGEYLTYAFKVDDQDQPLGDPDEIAASQSTLADSRVQNPSEDAYEAAVRGALEQFRSSPFFKHDPNSPYEQALETAFRDDTSIYTQSGQAASGETGTKANDETLLAEEQANQQAHQLRGMIVQDLIVDLQDYAELPEDGSVDAQAPKDIRFVNASIAFQMGLVFRFKGSPPAWLTAANPAERPQIAQRPSRDSVNPWGDTLATEASHTEQVPDSLRQVRTFNIERADFGTNPPQFEQVQVLTDTNTIAIAWDLTWRQPPEDGCSSCQREPEHHLMHYQVRRRSLDSQERETVYTLKPAEGVCFEAYVVTPEVIAALRSLIENIFPQLQTLAASQRDALTTALDMIVQGLADRSFPSAEAFVTGLQAAFAADILVAEWETALDGVAGLDLSNVARRVSAIIQSRLEVAGDGLAQIALNSSKGILKRLRPRFQLVDHFTAETLDDQAALPATGRSYLYSITPIDFTKTPGRPLSLVATRYPSEPPRVPVDGELKVEYRLSADDFAIANDTDQATLPAVLLPERISMGWHEPAALKVGPRVPIAKYRLVFRRDQTLPIGNYGLDSSTQGPRSKNLPTSNARTLPTDIKVRLKPPLENQDRTTVQALEVDGLAETEPSLLATLIHLGILPGTCGESASDLTPGQWRPEAWQVFFQTESANGVPSALAPVKLLLDFRSDRGLEERQPAQLEWLPQPLRLPLLPPEDSRIVVAQAHVPMLTTDTTAHFNGSLSNIAYQLHPAALRLLRLRWNQGPSHQPTYPLSLNAGYTLLELDVDANTTEVFNDTARLAEALREIQQVQLLPASDLTLTPKDTLAANQWEAWYLSRIRRRRYRSSQVEGSRQDQGSWYSWRESDLVWPAWPELSDPDQREAALHPLLQAIVETLDENPVDYPLTGSAPLPTYNVDLQFGPPRTPGDFAAFRDLTAPKADPYGWSILQRLGLSVVLTLRDEATNELVTSETMLRGVSRAIAALKADIDRTYGGHPLLASEHSLADHLHVELLFQPGQSFSPLPGEVIPTSLLAMVQISLRPVVRQYLTYSMVEIAGAANTRLDLFIDLKEEHLPCTLIDQSVPAREQALRVSETNPVRQPITLPLNGQTRLLLRHLSRPPLRLRIDLSAELALPTIAELSEAVSEDAKRILTELFGENGTLLEGKGVGVITGSDSTPPQIEVALSQFEEFRSSLNSDQRHALRTAIRSQLAPEDEPLANLLFSVRLAAFTPQDEQATYFTVPTQYLAEQFADTRSDRGQPWQQAKIYLESINSTDPSLPAIALPTTADAISDLLPDYLSWTQRFFDAYSGEIGSAQSTATGPWIATAYPRISTPAYASPDASGRIQYDHLLSDRWAHNYRYYIRPGSRYDLLWQSLLQSASLFELNAEGASDLACQLDTYVVSARSLSDLTGKLSPSQLQTLQGLQNRRYLGRQKFSDALQSLEVSFSDIERRLLLKAVETFRDSLPDPEAGGLDVTIERSEPIEKPLILKSGRLDPPARAGQPTAPGRTWEVIVAQHPEQLLTERNQTLKRRLDYQQMAFTLLRRFAYQDWLQQLNRISKSDPKVQLQEIENKHPAIPEAYPAAPDHLDLENLSLADSLSLDLPLRNENFQQGALVLQWDALPFFYEYRLLLVAQSASTVSEINEVRQRDFEYFSPTPAAQVSSIEAPENAIALPERFQTDRVTSPLPVALRTRQLDIPLKRLWDALSETVQAQWDDENPDRDNNPSPERCKPAALPDPEVIYQIVELFSGNVEVQAEYFFDPKAQAFALRQLGQRFLGEPPQLLAPSDDEHPAAGATEGDETADQPAIRTTDYVLRARLQQVQELQLLRPIYLTDGLFAETENKIILRTPLPAATEPSAPAVSLSLIGGFDQRDRLNLLLNSVAELQTLRRDLGVGNDLAGMEAFLAQWYTTSRFAETPVLAPDLAAPEMIDGVPISLPLDIVDYPEVPTTIPDQLRPKLIIRYDAVEWNSPFISQAELRALNGYRQNELKAHHRPVIDAIAQLIQALETTEVSTQRYQDETGTIPALRPHFIKPIDPAFSIQVNYPTAADPGSWQLRWQGAISPAQEASLNRHATTYETAYKNGVRALISQVKASRAPASQTFSEDIPFAWPRLDQLTPEERRAFLGNPLKGLRGDGQRLSWQGAHNLQAASEAVTPEALANLVRDRLEPGDPFIAAFADLMQQLDQQIYQRQIRLHLLRVNAPTDASNLTDEEIDRRQRQFQDALFGPVRAALAQKFAAFKNPASNQAPEQQTPYIQDIFKALEDRLIIDALYEAGCSREPISTPLTEAELQARNLAHLVDFPAPTETVLVWSGAVTEAEREAVLELIGDQTLDAAFATALESMTRLRLTSADLPEVLRNQLQITATELIWSAQPPRREQISALQDLSAIADDDLRNSLRRLTTALLNESHTRVPLAPLPEIRRRSIPLPTDDTNRPLTADLAPLLQAKLLIGNALIRYHGLMTVTEGQALRSLYTTPSDRSAIQRLFEKTPQQGLQGRELKIRARRGSAAPSQLQDLSPRPLPQD